MRVKRAPAISAWRGGVANRKVLKDSRFDRIWIQPAAGDAGGSLGAALCAHHLFKSEPRSVNSGDTMHGAYLGPEFSNQEIEQRLTAAGAKLESVDEVQLIERTTDALAEGKAIGWFQGRMEFGPRALGNRSILRRPVERL